MIREVMKDGVYKCFDNDRLLLTLTSLGNNIYRAINLECDITAEIIPVDEYKTSLRCLEHKRFGKDGRLRKTTKLLNSNLTWLDYILEETGFIRKKKCTE